MSKADVSRDWSKREADLLRKKEATQERIRTYRKRIAELEAAEALADDFENQNAELCMGLDDAQGRVSELEGVLEKVKQACLFDDEDGQIGITLDPSFPQSLFSEICQALTSDGSRIMDVVKAAHFLLTWTYQGAIDVDEMPPRGYWTVGDLHPGVWNKMNSAEQDLYHKLMALDRLDGAEGGS